MKKFLALFLLAALACFALADVYTIGDGTSTQNYIPAYGFYDYGWTKTIYTAAEINAAGLTTAAGLVGIGYEVGNTPANYTMLDQRVYIRNTTATMYEATDNTLPPNAQFTQVYQGDLTYNGGGWHYVMFSTPYAWDGTSNLEILWENWDADYVTGYPNFRYTATTEYKAVYKYADNAFPGEATGTLYYNRPNIQFVTPQLTPPNPAVAIYPTLNGYAFTDAVLSWQSGGGMPNSYDVYLGTSNPPTTLVSPAQTSTSYTPTGLQAATTYYWQIIPINSNGPATNCPVWSFKTPAAEQLAQSFNETTWPPPGWANLGSFTRSTTTPFHGAASAYKYAPTTPALLSTPMVTITGDSVLDFWVRTSATTGNGRLQIQSSPDRENWTDVGNIIEVPANTAWNNFTVNLGALAGNSYYLAFAASSTTSSTAIYIDHVFGPNITPLVPGPVILTAPADAAVNQSVFPVLSWTAGTTGGVAASYNVYLDTNPNPTTLIGTSSTTSYTLLTSLEYNTTYYWKVIASNSAGDSEASAVNSFTTMSNPIISNFPWIVDFGTATTDWPVLNWTQLNGLYPTPTGTSAQWFQDDWLNNTTAGNKCAKINIYGTLRNGWLVTPPINIPAEGYELKFDAAFMIWNGTTPPTGTQDDDKFIVVMSDTPNMSNPVILREWNNTGSSYVLNSIPHTGENYSIILNGISGIKYFAFYGESTVSNGDNDLMIDNVTIRQIPTAPVFHITPDAHDFGTVILDAPQAANFTVSNQGLGSLGVNTVTVSGSPFFTLSGLPTLPQALSTGQSFTFTANYLPTAAGNHSATITLVDDLGRTTHTVMLTGTGFDATITSFPYSQNFDEVAPPALPVGWSHIYQASVTTGYVKTVTTSPQSTPNCVAMYNPTDANTIAMLIAPPLATATAANTVRVKFWGKGSTTYAVKVGVMTNPSDAASFTELETITLSSTWTQYNVPLTTYTGTGRFIAFKHANNSTGQTIYIDTVELEIISPNDLAATLLSGNSTPSVNSATNYTVTVFNNGTAAQSTYTVKLYDANNVELATANGVTVNPGTQVDISLSWTPTQEGPMSIYGKVILTGDANPANDQTLPMAIMVQPAGVISVTIGSGDQTARMPLDFFYKNSLYQTLYYPTEIGMYGNITTMSIYNQFTTATLTNMPTKIWMGTTTQADLSAGWIPSTQMTLVYDGSLAYPAGANTITYPLLAPFSYSTGNLVVMFNRPMDTQYYSSQDYFQGQVLGTSRARNIYSDSVTYDPAAPTGGTVTGQFPKTTFTMTPLSDDPMFMVSPASHDFGDVNLGGSRSQVFNIMNIGGGTLGINSISITGSATFSLSDLPTLPVSLTTGSTSSFTVTYTPGSLGVTTATVSITDNLGATRSIGIGDRQNPVSRTVHTIELTGNGVNDLTVGAGDQNANWPMNFYWKNSLFETLYYPDELSNFTGMITGLKFYTDFSTNLTDMPTAIWLGTTTQADLSTDWIPSTQLTQVFSGNVNYPSGVNTISINFPEPFMYLNGENLVMMVHRPMDTDYYSSYDYFKNQTIGTNRARRMNSDSTVYDPAAPTGGTLTGQFPKTTFVVIPGGVGHITGTVLGAGNAPLEGVQVNVDNRPYSTTTNAQGQFTIPNVLPGNYAVAFSKYGYVSQTQNIVLDEDETEVMNITMAQMAMVNVSGTILASDTGLGISGASINLVGYANYSGSSIGNGSFVINNVYANQSYAYSITAAGYSSASGTINVSGTNHAMGNITLNEIAYAPNTVAAVVNDTYSAVNLTWNAPDPTAIEITESFEGTTFPPTDWTQSITNNGPANTVGVYPTWCQFGAITISGEAVTPTDGNNQVGLWWSYEHQDEWLVTPSFNCPPGAYLSFDSYIHYGSTNGDHYYVKVSTNGGSTWDILWDASTLPESDNYYAFPITIDLSAYSGLQVMLAFHAEDPPSDDGLWYVWFVDNIYIGNMISSVRFLGSELTSRSAKIARTINQMGMTPNDLSRAHTRAQNSNALASRAQTMPVRVSDRALVGYKVWRLTAGQEANESTWVSITPDVITTLNHSDPGWNTLPNGTYKWAVKAVYTADVLSAPAMSNPLVKEQVSGTIVGFVRRANNQGISGATVTAGGISATTNPAGAYSLILPAGVYSVTATANNFHPLVADNVVVSPNQTTTLNFVMTPSANEDDVIPVLATTLAGNFPNPFNPETTISYAIKEPTKVRLEVYNLRGQMVRSLVASDQASGHYRVVFDARDDRGKPLASGIYLYRLTAGSYTSTRKMMLME